MTDTYIGLNLATPPFSCAIATEDTQLHQETTANSHSFCENIIHHITTYYSYHNQMEVYLILLYVVIVIQYQHK